MTFPEILNLNHLIEGLEPDPGATDAGGSPPPPPPHPGGQGSSVDPSTPESAVDSAQDEGIDEGIDIAYSASGISCQNGSESECDIYTRANIKNSRESQPTVRYRGGTSDHAHRIDCSCLCSYIMLCGHGVGVQQIATVLMFGKL